MKVGDLVTHNVYGWKGRITEVHTDTWFSNYGTDLPDSTLYNVKWDGVKKKYNRGRCYDSTQIAPLHLLAPSGSALGDWLMTPAEKLRSALAAKTERTQLANTRRKPRRLDGR